MLDTNSHFWCWRGRIIWRILACGDGEPPCFVSPGWIINLVQFGHARLLGYHRSNRNITQLAEEVRPDCPHITQQWICLNWSISMINSLPNSSSWSNKEKHLERKNIKPFQLYFSSFSTNTVRAAMNSFKISIFSWHFNYKRCVFVPLCVLLCVPIKFFQESCWSFNIFVRLV